MIESVRLHQMRSWADGTVALTPGAHIFWGENGAGKTTILEACIIAATGRSHRAGALREVIAGDGDQASIMVTVRDDGADPTDTLARSTLGVEISRAGRAKHVLNGTPRTTAALGQRLRVAAFVPEETGLVVGAPSVRRGLLDRVASQWQRGYEATLTRYERALRQRNRLLKNALEVDGAARRAIASEMRPWTEMLITAGSEVVAGRLALLAALAPVLSATHNEVAPSEAALETHYLSREEYRPDESASECATRLSQSFDQTAETEGYQGYTLVGPHRDDITFHVGGATSRQRRHGANSAACSSHSSSPRSHCSPTSTATHPCCCSTTRSLSLTHSDASIWSHASPRFRRASSQRPHSKTWPLDL